MRLAFPDPYSTRRSRPALLLATAVAACVLVAPAAARAQTGSVIRPVLDFPEPGLDDPASYEGYRTRFYRDVAGNAVQIYLKRDRGRVLHVWADALNESLGFTARDTAGATVELAWAGDEARSGERGGMRWIEYELSADAPAVDVGWFLLGSMRVERDFQYREWDLRPFGADPFLRPELDGLIERVRWLPEHEQRRHLELLGADDTAALRERLRPRLELARGDMRWTLRVDRPSFDGRNRLTLRLSGDARRVAALLDDGTLRLRALDAEPIRLTVRVATDGPPLTPLGRETIFNDAFRRYYERARAAADAAPPGSDAARRFRRLERRVRGVELVSYEEKLMAGLPNFATYFGRDMMMTALMMEPIWTPAMHEHVIAGVLRKLDPAGEVSHEEALGGQAIRENAARYNELVGEYFLFAGAGEDAAADSVLARARDVLADLQAVRENYLMVDDDFQLAVLVARYLTGSRASDDRKRAFLGETVGATGETRLVRLLRNFVFIAGAAAPYARQPTPDRLVAFPPFEDGCCWFPGSWRDSRVGYADGRFAMDVNVIWVPRALRAVARTLETLRDLGFERAELERAAPELAGTRLAEYLRDASVLRRDARTWEGAERHFLVELSPEEVRERVNARLAWLPADERAYWRGVLQTSTEGGDGPLARGIRFLALSLDPDGQPIPVLNTDPATRFFLAGAADDAASGAHRERVLRDLRAMLRPFPVGLLVDGLGPLVANDAYASQSVWTRFHDDRYHSPYVVWGREVNLLMLSLAGQIAGSSGGVLDGDPNASSFVGELRDALREIEAAVDASGLAHNELWSYRIRDGRLVPVRYGSSSDVQLWNLTDLAVDFVLDGARRERAGT